ncbi:NXPE family member 4-like [Discoglossus pictus]
MARGYTPSALGKVPEIQMGVNYIFNKIDDTIPKISFTHKGQTSSANRSRVIIINPRNRYCVGDHLIVQVDMFDYMGNRKTYGGDYLRARIFTTKLGAGASGSIVDFNNGSYHVHFILFWEGYISVSVFLMHPSEGVSVLWNSRNIWYGNVNYSGKFTSLNKQIETKCGFKLDNSEETCEYGDHQDEEYFYCVRPPNCSCDSLTRIKSWFTDLSNMTPLEASLFERSNVRMVIPIDSEPLNVVRCKFSTDVKNKCKIGMKLEYPGGHFMRKVWNPRACSMETHPSMEKMNQCMQGKLIYMFGDSTLRQWMLYFQSKLKTMTCLNLYEDGWAQQLLGIDLTRNMKVLWKRHALPFVNSGYHSCTEDRTIPREIDLIGGHQHIVIILNIGIHFRSHPVHHYIRRLLNIRHALERLFLRSPQTKVLFKTENTGEMDKSFESKSDFHAYIHYRILEIVFKDLNIGFINGWDMTNAFDSNKLHPPEEYIKNEIDMMLTYIC